MTTSNQTPLSPRQRFNRDATRMVVVAKIAAVVLLVIAVFVVLGR